MPDGCPHGNFPECCEICTPDPNERRFVKTAFTREEMIITRIEELEQKVRDLQEKTEDGSTPLVSLEDWNRSRREETSEKSFPRPNGIKCPNCSAQLWDSSPCCVNTGMPPSKDVHCRTCGFTGRRLV